MCSRIAVTVLDLSPRNRGQRRDDTCSTWSGGFAAHLAEVSAYVADPVARAYVDLAVAAVAAS